MFNKALKKVFLVKNISSPTAKMEYLAKLFRDIICIDAIIAADSIQTFIMYTLIKIGKQSAYLLIEQLYIEKFSHEDVIDNIEEYQNVAHMETAFKNLIDHGIEHMISNMQQGIPSRSGSLASYNYDFNSSSSDRKRSDQSNEEAMSSGSKCKNKRHSSNKKVDCSQFNKQTPIRVKPFINLPDTPKNQSTSG